MGKLRNYFLNHYPRTDFHELNQDWMISMLYDMINQVENFVEMNAVKYADPIQWDITRQYEKNTIVIDEITGTAYISSKPVPKGVALSRSEYWNVIFDIGRFITLAAQNFANSYEAVLTTTATMETDKDKWVVWNSILYRAKNDIHIGDRYVVDGNIEKYTVEMFFDELAHLITEETEARIEADTTLHSEIVDESVARENADITLQGNIDTVQGNVNAEAAARESADTTLQGNIDVEATTRENVDNEIKNIIGTLANLNTPNKTTVVDAINSIVDVFSDKDYVCPEDFGAVGDGVTDDTSAVQQALYANKPVKFLHDYAVTSVVYRNSNNFVDFNGHELIGIGQNNDFVLVIYEAMYNVFNNIHISISSGSRTHYYGCIRIHSSSSRQSQYNVFNGMDLRECWHGLVWGAKEGETSVSNAQSETFINNFRDRSVAVPFLGNQDNGYLTFIGSVFDVNQYEQWTDNRFSFDDNRCVVNHVGKVNFIGCEFAATINVNHVGFVGGDIHAYDSILEICGTQAFITGDFSLVNWYNGYIGQVSKTPFIVNNGAKGKVILENGTFHHGGVVAGNNLLYGYDAPETTVYLNNVTFADTPYSLDMFGNLNVKCNNFVLSADNITITDNDITGLSLIDNNSTDVTAFGEAISCVASFDSVIGRRGVAVQFNSEEIGSYYSEMIPIYGGTLYHANSCGFTDGNNVYVYLEFYDSTNTYIGVELLQTINGIRLNRSKLAYAPTGAKYCRLRITNDRPVSVYCITCDVALYWKRSI